MKRKLVNKITIQVKILVLVIFLIAAVFVTLIMRKQEAVPVTPEQTMGFTYEFDCNKGKKIMATFYPTNDVKVDLVLSDGRKMSLKHAISASGARYTNDEITVFWNKGNTAFITEKEVTTYDGCIQK